MRFTNVKCGVGQGWRITRDALRTNRRPLTAVRSRSSGLRIHAMVVTRLSGSSSGLSKTVSLAAFLFPPHKTESPVSVRFKDHLASGRNRSTRKRDLSRLTNPQMGKRDIHRTSRVWNTANAWASRQLVKLRSRSGCNRFAVCDTEVAGPLKERGLSESHGQRHEQQQFRSQMDRRKFPTETTRNVQHEDP
jgi:hypothetical protein